MMCCYQAHLYHVKVVGITVQMPHNGAPDCRTIHLCPGQSGITRLCTVNIHRIHSGIKNEDYLTKCGFIYFLSFFPFVSVIVLKIKKCSRMVVLCVQYYTGLFVDVNITCISTRALIEISPGTFPFNML